MHTWLSHLTTSLLLFALAACSAPQPVSLSPAPLFDHSHQPDVLTERQILAKPPNTSGNRFLTGWSFYGPHIPLVSNADSARLELVNLEQRPRTLILHIGDEEYDNPPAIDVRLAGKSLGSFSTAEQIEVPLPADLPVGRVTADLTIPTGRLRVRSARVIPNRRPGEVHMSDGVVRQTGWSAVDLVRHVRSDTTIRGTFAPPAEALPGQRFTCYVQHGGDAPIPVYQWSAGADRGNAVEPFSAELGGRDGLVRVRLMASGEGPPARWYDLELASTPPASNDPPTPPDAPRVVLLYVMDALRADALGHLGGRSEASPFLDDLADRGVTFTNHFAIAPSTLPSTKALFTGRAILRGRKLAAHGPRTLAQVFADAGYATASFSGNGFVSQVYGTTRGFQHVEVHPPIQDDEGSGFNDNAERVHEAALNWLHGRPVTDKIFLYLHTVHPHNPYDPPQPFRSRLIRDHDSSIDGSTPTLLSLRKRQVVATDADREQIIDLYLGGLAYNDSHLASLVHLLDSRYPSGEVLSIITSDHGEELFDHGGILHGYSLYDELLRIPLIMHWPDRLHRQKVDLATTTIDLHRSLRALVDFDATAPPTLWNQLNGGKHHAAEPRIRFAGEPDGVYMARSDHHKLIWAPRSKKRWGMGHGLGRSYAPEYFFNLDEDPAEMANRTGSGSLEEAWLRSLLLAWIATNTTHPEQTDTIQLDQKTRRQLEALGYMEPEAGR